jgi:5-methylcytosine-specific restriction endonuclease McrA
MPFSNLIVKKAWDRCQGRCECTNAEHDHQGRCKNPLTWLLRGGDNISGGWEAQHITPIEEGGTDEIINCRIVCMKCYQEQMQLPSDLKSSKNKHVQTTIT